MSNDPGSHRASEDDVKACQLDAGNKSIAMCSCGDVSSPTQILIKRMIRARDIKVTFQISLLSPEVDAGNQVTPYLTYIRAPFEHGL